MVQLFCLSAHRTVLSTPSLPSSLSPSFALTNDSQSVTRPKPPVSSCRASYHAASVAATVSASKSCIWLQNILAPVPPAFLIRPLPHLPLGNLSPVVSPGSPIHLSYRHRAAASCLSATVSSPASCRTASVCTYASEHSRHYSGSLELGTFQLVSVGFRNSGTPCRSCILQQPSLGRSVDETRSHALPPRPATRIRRLFLGTSLLMMLSCLS